MQVFKKESVGDLLLFDVLADMHCLKRKLSYFAGKYKADVEQFEKHINSAKESFAQYDDFI